MMEFCYSDEELMLQRSIREMFREKNSIEKVRNFVENKEENKLLNQLVSQLGLLNVLDLDNDVAKGLVSSVIIAQEAGRSLLTYPYIEAILSTALITVAQTKKEILSQIENGKLLPTIAWGTTDAVIEKKDDDIYIGNGILKEVPFANEADIIVASVRVAGSGDTKTQEEKLVLIETNRNELSINDSFSMDETYPLYHVALHDYSFKQSDFLFMEGGVNNFVLKEKVRLIAALLLAAEITGASEQMMYQTVEYMKERKQFGVAIGTFQSLKHMAADMFVHVESMKAAVDYSAWTLDVNHPEAKEAVSIAKSYASSKGIELAGNAIQMHGGIGYTWENDMHFYFKRIRRAASLLGDSYEHREKIATLVIK